LVASDAAEAIMAAKDISVKKYVVRLSGEEREQLEALIRKGKSAAQRLLKARISYSQNLEDYHLSLAFGGQSIGTYIDVGAGHPIADNVSFWFYERGWQACLPKT
jgi:hypothetical protein